MKTIFHAIADGLEIVLGFAEAFGLIDPVATSIKIAPMLLQLDEQKQLAALQAQIQARQAEATQALAMAKRALALDAKNKPLMDKHNAQYQVKLAEIAELEKQLPALVLAFEAARARLVAENAVYAHPPQGEELIDDAQAADLRAKFEARGPNRQLQMSGEYVDDYRGREYWALAGGQWFSQKLTRLGERPAAGSIPAEDLTDAQRAEISVQQETARVAALSPEQATAEAEAARQQVLSRASQMRSELEIAGDAEALAKSQEYYQQQLAEIAAKYGK